MYSQQYSVIYLFFTPKAQESLANARQARDSRVCV